MPTVQAHGLEVVLPHGYEARIFRRSAVAGERSNPVGHFGTFPLPTDAGDFGAGAVNLMGPGDVFVVLFEYGPESLGRALFARRGMPRTLGPEHFAPFRLRRGLGGHSGTQWFFEEAGRPFTLYAVLGSHAERQLLVPRLNQLLSGVRFHPRKAASGQASAGGPWN